MFSDPVDPIRTMSALPPYCVRFALRKKLVVGGCALGVSPIEPSSPKNWVQASCASSGIGTTSPITGRPDARHRC